MTTEKPELIEWSNSTPLVKVLEGGWKEYPIHDFHSEFIITMRMRGYVMDNNSVVIYPDGDVKEITKEEMQMHIVFHQPVNSKNGTKVYQPA